MLDTGRWGFRVGGMIRFMNHIAPSGFWAMGVISRMAEVFIAIFAGIWSARRHRARMARRMCNLYSDVTSQQGIRRLARAMRDATG